MAWQLSSVAIGNIGGAALFMAGFGIYTLYGKVSDAATYTKAGASISRIEFACSRPTKNVKPAQWDWRPCGEQAALSDDEIRTRGAVRARLVYFTYLSPADRRQHEGRYPAMGSPSDDSPRDRIFVGKTSTILVHDDNPADYKLPAYPFRADT